MIGWIREATKNCVWQHHLLSVYHVDVQGDSATALVYHTSYQKFEGDDDVCVLVGRYHDELTRHEGTWKISRLVFEIMWGERRADTAGYLESVGGRGPQVPSGGRDWTVMSAYRLPDWGGTLELVEVPVPAPRGREVLVEVRAVGLCHSDLFVMTCDAGMLPYDLPLTLGHEVAGRVVAVGERADSSLVGRDGVVHGVWSCGECHNCLPRAGQPLRGPRAAGWGAGWGATVDWRTTSCCPTRATSWLPTGSRRPSWHPWPTPGSRPTTRSGASRTRWWATARRWSSASVASATSPCRSSRATTSAQRGGGRPAPRGPGPGR